MVLIPQDTFAKEIIKDMNKYLRMFRYVEKNQLSCASCTFTHCLGGVGIIFACNGSITIDCRGLPAPSLSTVSEMWPV